MSSGAYQYLSRLPVFVRLYTLSVHPRGQPPSKTSVGVPSNTNVLFFELGGSSDSLRLSSCVDPFVSVVFSPSFVVDSCKIFCASAFCGSSSVFCEFSTFFIDALSVTNKTISSFFPFFFREFRTISSLSSSVSVSLDDSPCVIVVGFIFSFTSKEISSRNSSVDSSSFLGVTITGISDTCSVPFASLSDDSSFAFSRLIPIIIFGVVSFARATTNSFICSRDRFWILTLSTLMSLS
mmetsp:Transcript_8141/g.12718  ORF Transcript_8141/g.12718 Transcript_8141/m.12718 type:complete len:237 (+) Transcript_8141:2209-2919(+)